jgi:hypothetical protein
MKNLPLNTRAMGIAEACGKPTHVYGDIFMGRLYEDADDFVRLSFELKVRASAANARRFTRGRPLLLSWNLNHLGFGKPLESRPKASARLDLEVSAGWASSSSRGM